MLQNKHISTTVVTHATKALGTFSDTGRTTVNCNSDFSRLYGISSTLTGTFGFSTIESYINANKPIFAAISWSGGGGHAVAISGWDQNGPSVEIMDPWYGWECPTYSTFLTNYLGSGTWSQSIHFN